MGGVYCLRDTRLDRTVGGQGSSPAAVRFARGPETITTSGGSRHSPQRSCFYLSQESAAARLRAHWPRGRRRPRAQAGRSFKVRCASSMAWTTSGR